MTWGATENGRNSFVCLTMAEKEDGIHGWLKIDYYYGT